MKRFSKFTRGSSVFHTSMRNKQVEFNPYIYTLSKLSRFGYEISVFKYTTGYSEQPPEQPAHTSRQQFHGKMDVKIVLMFIVAENTGSVNIKFGLVYLWFYITVNNISVTYVMAYRFAGSPSRM